jgi:hypothetical protein
VMLTLAVWTCVWLYISIPWLLNAQRSPVCELIIKPNVYNLFHHEGYQRYYTANRQKIDRLWGLDESLTQGHDLEEDNAYKQQHDLVV